MPALNSLYSSLCFMVKDNLADPKHFTNNSQLRCNCGGGGWGGGVGSKSASGSGGPSSLADLERRIQFR